MDAAFLNADRIGHMGARLAEGEDLGSNALWEQILTPKEVAGQAR